MSARHEAVEGFQFSQGKAAKATNIGWYLEELRTFLAENPGEVLWVKGGIIEQEAYMLADAALHEQLKSFWRNRLSKNHNLAMRPLESGEINELIEKSRRGLRLYLGGLEASMIPMHEPRTKGDGDGKTLKVYFCANCKEEGRLTCFLLRDDELPDYWAGQPICSECANTPREEEAWVCPTCQLPGDHGSWCSHEGRQLPPLIRGEDGSLYR